jgi:hypothetical protein
VITGDEIASGFVVVPLDVVGKFAFFSAGKGSGAAGAGFFSNRLSTIVLVEHAAIDKPTIIKIAAFI